MQDFSIVHLNMVCIFDVLLNSLEVERSYNLASSYNNSCLISSNEVYHDFRFDIFKYSINVSNVSAGVFYELYLIIIAHWNNDLLSQQLFCHYMNSWFRFTFTIDNFLNVFNFFCPVYQETFFLKLPQYCLKESMLEHIILFGLFSHLFNYSF